MIMQTFNILLTVIAGNILSLLYIILKSCFTLKLL